MKIHKSLTSTISMKIYVLNLSCKQTSYFCMGWDYLESASQIIGSLVRMQKMTKLFGFALYLVVVMLLIYNFFFHRKGLTSFIFFL